MRVAGVVKGRDDVRLRLLPIGSKVTR